MGGEEVNALVLLCLTSRVDLSRWDSDVVVVSVRTVRVANEASSISRIQHHSNWMKVVPPGTKLRICSTVHIVLEGQFGEQFIPLRSSSLVRGDIQ